MNVYTDAQRIEALAALEANAGNVKRTSRETGIPRQTLTTWRDMAVAYAPRPGPTTSALVPVTVKTDWEALSAAVVREAAAQVRAKLPSMSGRDAAIAYGIAADKYLAFSQGRRGSRGAEAGEVVESVTFERRTKVLT